MGHQNRNHYYNLCIYLDWYNDHHYAFHACHVLWSHHCGILCYRRHLLFSRHTWLKIFNKIVIVVLWNEVLNSDGQQFHQYQQNERSLSSSLTEHNEKTTTYGLENRILAWDGHKNVTIVYRCRILNLPHSKPSPGMFTPSEYLLYSKPSPRYLTI